MVEARLATHSLTADDALDLPVPDGLLGYEPGGQQRILDYLEAGVRLVWAIDPHSRTATAYRPDGSARLPGPRRAESA